MKQYHYLYKITNNINNNIYIGIHSTDDLNDGYMGSGVAITRAIKKHGIENFTKEILEWFDWRCELIAREAEVVTREFISHPNVYNMFLGGESGAYGFRHTDCSIQKMRDSHIGLFIGYKHTANSKQNMSKAAYKRFSIKSNHPFYGKNRFFTSIWKQNLSRSMQGTRVGINNNFYGKQHTPEAITKIKEKRALQVISESHINAFKSSRCGVKVLDSTKAKISALQSMKCSIDGVIYNSLISASKELNISDTTVGRRLKSDKYPTWIYL
jgi:group I intron endonuclease